MLSTPDKDVSENGRANRLLVDLDRAARQCAFMHPGPAAGVMLFSALKWLGKEGKWQEDAEA